MVTVGKKNKKISILLCITEKKVFNYQLFDGSVTGKDDGAFILNVISQNDEIRLNIDHYVWYMDNAQIHKASCIASILESINVYYASPYSPFLNPIEEVFGLWKHYIRERAKNNRNELLKDTMSSLCKIHNKVIPHYVRYHLDFLVKSLNKEKIE